MALLERQSGPVNEIVNYQLHATLRAFARAQLFGSERLRDANLGLQLQNISEDVAHLEFVNRYRKRAPASELTALEDDGYIHNNLIWHVQRAGATTELNNLLSKDSPDGGNAWFSVRQANGRLDHYIDDAKSAWRYTIDTKQSIAQVLRYSLYLATAWETVPGISFKLAEELIHHRVWDGRAVQSYLSVLPENEETAASRAAILLAAAEGGCVEIDGSLLLKCALAAIASNVDALRVKAASLLVQALEGAAAMATVKGICGIQFSRFLDATYDRWNKAAQEMVVDQTLEKLAEEPDDHLFKAIGAFPARVGNLSQWARLQSLVANHPNQFVREWSQLELMQLLLSRGEIRNAIRLSRAIEHSVVAVRARALLLPFRGSARNTSRVTDILNRAATIDDQAYRKDVYSMFYARRVNVSAAYWDDGVHELPPTGSSIWRGGYLRTSRTLSHIS